MFKCEGLELFSGYRVQFEQGRGERKEEYKNVQIKGF